ncbi:MAG: hypothetical protein IKE69_02515 [Thermoguttaceae bacterium]|nr:hypothetical protein [Thermoguttaceae bacterium]
MSRGNAARYMINTSIGLAAGMLLLFAPARLSAQYSYQSIISPDAAEKSVAPLPALPSADASSSAPIPEYRSAPAAAPAADRTRRPEAQSLASAPTPVRVAQESSPQGAAPAAGRRENAVPPARLYDADAHSGLLPENANDGILPPPEDFRISPQEAALLDQFLAKWEEFGKNIKKVACNVTSKEQGGGLYGEDRDVPLSHTYGEFKFIAPNKLLYHVIGEFVYEKDEKGQRKPEYKKGLDEKKFVLDGKSLTEYDYKNRVALVTPIPEDQQNKDLTMDGPIPIFFIAKADNLKRRFYMKLITKPEKQDSEVWIEAWPRQQSDAQSFQRIIITLRLSDLQPYYMRQYHSNGKSYTELWFSDISINKGLWTIEPKVDFGWKKEESTPSRVSLSRD